VNGTNFLMEQISTSPPTERQLPAVAVDAIRTLLPASWKVAVRRPARGATADATLRVTAPDRRTADVAVEATSRLETRDVVSVAQQLRAIEASASLVAARYLSPRTRDALRAEGVSYVDATGNVDVSVDTPAIVLRAAGADRDPWRSPEQPMGSLRGLPAARVVRALVDLEAPWRMRELATAAGASLGSTARTVDLLDREALIERDERGAIQTVRWDELLEHWAADYDLTRGRRVEGLLAARGLDALEATLRESDLPYAVGGSLAARWQLSYAEPTTAIVYALDADEFVPALGLRPAPSRPNVLVIEPRDDLPLIRAQQQAGVTYTAPSQTVADLFNGPGRNPEEGRALLDWMRSHESGWRRR
jgi:hypothetical protein